MKALAIFYSFSLLSGMWCFQVRRLNNGVKIEAVKSPNGADTIAIYGYILITGSTETIHPPGYECMYTIYMYCYRFS